MQLPPDLRAHAPFAGRPTPVLGLAVWRAVLALPPRRGWRRAAGPPLHQLELSFGLGQWRTGLPKLTRHGAKRWRSLPAKYVKQILVSLNFDAFNKQWNKFKQFKLIDVLCFLLHVSPTGDLPVESYPQAKFMEHLLPLIQRKHDEVGKRAEDNVLKKLSLGYFQVEYVHKTSLHYK
eukprot:1176136-Amphidinium_carterae.1